MRDIVPDLKERLRGFVEQRDQFLDQANALEPKIDLLMRMVELEQQRQEGFNGQNAEALQQPDDILPDFVLKAIQHRPMTKADLLHSAASAGYKRIDGRHIHATILNLLRGGKIVEKTEGVFASADADAGVH
jgi:hypothetical protein